MCKLNKTVLKKLISVSLCILMSIACFTGASLADFVEREDNAKGVVVVCDIDITLTKVQNLTATRVKYRVDLSCGANVPYSNLNIDNITVSLSPSGSPIFTSGALSYAFPSAVYSSTHTGIGYVVLTVGVGGTTTVYASTTQAKGKFVSPYGWRNINNLTALPIHVYN